MALNAERQSLAYLGPEASFTHEVALDLLTSHPMYREAQLRPCLNIAAVCQMVADGAADSGVVPIENSTDGPVNDTLVALRQHPLHIRYGRTNPIRQSLYYRKGVNLADITLVISKDSALGQCRRTLHNIFQREVPTETRASTVTAILEAAQNPYMAAIGPRMAGKIQGLSEVLVQMDDIHDNPLNATRFIVVDTKDEDTPITGHDKTSMIVQMSDRPGSLYHVLDAFVEQGINLAKIKSFGRDGGEVAFLMDLEGHRQDLPLTTALNRLSRLGVGVKMLGSYPRDIYQPPEISWEFDMEYSIEQLIGEVANGVNHRDKTVVAFTLIDKVGALRDALEPFKSRDINLTEIDSLPTGKLGEYIFYLSFENGVGQSRLAINELMAQCSRVRLIA